ncbi:MAG: cyclase family protein [Ilumatobacteraceae bacterium]
MEHPSSSQWDGFRHIRNHAALADEPGTGHYGAVADDDHGMHHWARRGIVGQAVLADVGRWRDGIGRPLRHDESDPIEPEELAECLAAQGTELHEGDVLLVRTGWIGWYEAQPDDVRARLARTEHLRTPGLRSGAPGRGAVGPAHRGARLRQPGRRGVAAGCAEHPGARSRGARRSAPPARDLHPHAAAADARPAARRDVGPRGARRRLRPDGRYECFFTSAPINLPAGVASPPNALAIK